jgi:diguanylate cyclase (GGDEF)-like protein
MQQDKALGILLELGNLSDRRTRAELLERAMQTARLVMDADAVVILNPSSRRGQRLALYSGSSTSAVLPAAEEGSHVVRRFVESCQPVVLSELSEDASIAEADGCPGIEPGPVMFVPLRQREPALGYIGVYRRRGRARFTTGDARAILLLAAYLGSALECQRLASGVQKHSVTDDLTEVYNARFLKAALRREFLRAGRFGQELSVVMIDVDHLASKQDGDALQGSVLLRELASVLAQLVRSFDILAKHGDDEFMLVLPPTDLEGSLEVAERIRLAVEKHSFAHLTSGAVTVSLGVGSFPREGADEKAVVAKARRALILAKERGRNRVETLVRKAA